MKKIIIIVIAIALVASAGVGIGVGVGIYQGQPEVVTLNAAVNALEGLSERQETAPLISLLQGGSIQFSGYYDSAKASGEEHGTKLELSGKLYLSEKELLLNNLVGTLTEYNGVEKELSGELYIGQDYSFLSNSEILGGSYGIVRGQTADSFLDSEYAKGLTEEQKEMIFSALEFYDSSADLDMRKEAEKILERYTKLLFKSFADNAEFEEDVKRVKLSDERIESRVITVTLTTEAIAEILRDLYDQAVEDEALESFFLKYSEYFEDALIANGALTDGDTVDELYDELMEEAEDAIDSFEDRANEDEGFEFELVTLKNSSNMCKLTVSSFYKESDYRLFTLDLGKAGAKKTDKIQLTLGENAEIYTYEVKERSDEDFKAQLTYKSAYIEEEENIFTLSIDREKESFRLSILDGECIIRGGISQKRGTATLTLDKVTLGEASYSDGFELTLIFKSRDKASPSIKSESITSVFQVDSEDTEAWQRKLEEEYERIFKLIAEYIPQ